MDFESVENDSTVAQPADFSVQIEEHADEVFGFGLNFDFAGSVEDGSPGERAEAKLLGASRGVNGANIQ
jgi:hypothetical protein